MVHHHASRHAGSITLTARHAPRLSFQFHSIPFRSLVHSHGGLQAAHAVATAGQAVPEVAVLLGEHLPQLHVIVALRCVALRGSVVQASQSGGIINTASATGEVFQ
jgi:hypothetical protein